MVHRHEISEDDLTSLRIIREIRTGLHITQTELANKADYSRQGIANLEANRNGTTWANALVILQRLGCRVSIECPELDRVYIVKERE